MVKISVELMLLLNFQISFCSIKSRHKLKRVCQINIFLFDLYFSSFVLLLQNFAGSLFSYEIQKLVKISTTTNNFSITFCGMYVPLCDDMA